MQRSISGGTGAPNERSRLLSDDAPVVESNDVDNTVDKGRKRGVVPLSYWIFFVAFLFFLESGDAMQEAPKLQLYEQILCNNYYSRTDTASPRINANATSLAGNDCKLAPIQSELAFLNGVQEALIALPAILISIPAAYAADRFGRRPVMVLTISGYLLGSLWTAAVCAFPQVLSIYCIWLFPVFLLLGGGSSTATSLIFATVGDLVSEEHRVNTYIGLVTASLVSITLSRCATSLLLAVDVWLPVAISLGLTTICAILAAFWPHTTTEKVTVDSSQSSPKDTTTRPSTLHSGMWNHVRERIISLTRLINLPKPAFALFTVALLGFVSRYFQTPFLQYASRKFHISYSKANTLDAILSASNFVTLLGFFPLTGHILLTKFKFTTYKKDMVLLKLATTGYFVGALMLGLASTFTSGVFGVAVFGGGAGSQAFLRSMVLSLIPREQYNVAQTVISVLMLCGRSIAGPLYSILMAKSFSLPGIWAGLPCYVAGLFSFVALIILTCMKS